MSTIFQPRTVTTSREENANPIYIHLAIWFTIIAIALIVTVIVLILVRTPASSAVRSLSSLIAVPHTISSTQSLK